MELLYKYITYCLEDSNQFSSLLFWKGAVVLDEFTSKNLRHTLDKLISDCDRHQSMVQQLISSSHRIQWVTQFWFESVTAEIITVLLIMTVIFYHRKDADEERNRASNHEMEVRHYRESTVKLIHIKALCMFPWKSSNFSCSRQTRPIFLANFLFLSQL